MICWINCFILLYIKNDLTTAYSKTILFALIFKSITAAVFILGFCTVFFILAATETMNNDIELFFVSLVISGFIPALLSLISSIPLIKFVSNTNIKNSYKILFISISFVPINDVFAAALLLPNGRK